MTASAELLSVAQEVAEVSRLVDAEDLESILGRYVDRLVDTVPGCDHASITVGTNGGLETVAGTGLAELLDLPSAEVVGAGPILEAVTFREPRRIADVQRDERWPAYTARMVTAGFRSALVLPLAAVTEPAAALTLFAREPEQFAETSYDVAMLFVLHAGVVFDNVSLYQDSTTLVRHLREALGTRSTIGQAQGLLMHRHGYPAEQAFTVLRETSQRRNLKLRAVAATLVEAVREQRLDQALADYGLG